MIFGILELEIKKKEQDLDQLPLILAMAWGAWPGLTWPGLGL
jgi:hypothetical protein